MSLKNQIIRSLSWLLFYTRALTLFNILANRFKVCTNDKAQLVFPFVRKRHARNFQTLIFHRVNNDNDPFFPAIPISVFSKQMEYLAYQFNVCSLVDAVEMLKMKDVPDNAVVITFDDGYKDIYLNAFPILKKLSIPAYIEILHKRLRFFFQKVYSCLFFPESCNIRNLWYVWTKNIC